MFVQQQMIIAEVRSRHVPVKILGLEIEGEKISHDDVESVSGCCRVWEGMSGYVGRRYASWDHDGLLAGHAASRYSSAKITRRCRASRCSVCRLAEAHLPPQAASFAVRAIKRRECSY